MSILRTASFALSGYVLFAVFRFTVGLALPGVTATFHLTAFESGVFASAPLLAPVLTMAVAGYVSDRVNKKIIFSIGLLFLWLGVLLCSVSPSYQLALIFMFMAGAGTGLLPPSIYSIMGGLRPRSRASLTGVTASVYNFGGFIGSIGLGVAIAISGWRLSLAGLAVSGLVYLPLMFLLMGPLRETKSSVTAVRSSGSSYSALLRSRDTIFAGLSLLLATYASFVITSWAPTYMSQIGIGSSMSGLVIGIFALAGGVGAVVSGRIADVWGEKRLMVITGAIGGVVSLVLYLCFSEFGLMTSLVAVLGLMTWPSWNLATSMVQRITDPATVGSITGLVQTFGIAGGFLAPIVTGVLVKYVGLEEAMLGSVAVSLWLYALLIVPFNEAPGPRSAQ